MRIQHKQARDTVIALNVGRFEVDSEGFLRPTPTPAQWQRFGGAQCYFDVIEDAGPSPAATEEAPVEGLPAAEHTTWTPDGVVEAAPAPAPTSDFAWDDEDAEEDDDEDVEAPLAQADAFAGDVDDLDAAETEDPPRYGEMSYAELKEACKDRGIPVARASREELISRLNADDLGV